MRKLLIALAVFLSSGLTAIAVRALVNSRTFDKRTEAATLRGYYLQNKRDEFDRRVARLKLRQLEQVVEIVIRYPIDREEVEDILHWLLMAIPDEWVATCVANLLQRRGFNQVVEEFDFWRTH